MIDVKFCYLFSRTQCNNKQVSLFRVVPMTPLKGLALFHFFILNQCPCCVDIPQLNRPHNISLISLCTFHSYLSEYFKVNTLILEMAGFLSRDFQPFCTHIYLLTFVDQTSLFQMLHGEIIKLWLTLGKYVRNKLD